MDRALGVEVLALGVDRLAFEIELDDVVALDALGRARTRQEEPIRLVRMADADMAERIDDAVLGQHVVRGHKVFDQIVELRHERFSSRMFWLLLYEFSLVGGGIGMFPTCGSSGCWP